jgi:chitinase
VSGANPGLRSVVVLSMLLLAACANPSGDPDVGIEPPPDDPDAVVSGFVMGYWVGYERDQLPPEELDLRGVTHVAIGRLVPRPDGSLDETFDTFEGPALALDVIQRVHDAGKKAILMVGGAGAREGFIGAASDENRLIFVANLAEAMQRYGVDGLDIDWEPIDASDEPSLRALSHGLRETLPDATLTLPVIWAGGNPAFIAELAPLYDHVNIMSYGMADAFPGWDSWHSSALRGESLTTPSSVDLAVRMYLAAGVEASRLGVGVGFYGLCFTGGVTGPRQVLTEGQRVTPSFDGFPSYIRIATDFNAAATRQFDDVAQVPFLAFAEPQGPGACTFVSYEDSESIAAKGAYAKELGLGGAILWSMGQQHFRDRPEGARDPLMSAAGAAFLTVQR